MLFFLFLHSSADGNMSTPTIGNKRHHVAGVQSPSKRKKNDLHVIDRPRKPIEYNPSEAHCEKSKVCLLKSVGEKNS